MTLHQYSKAFLVSFNQHFFLKKRVFYKLLKRLTFYNIESKHLNMMTSKDVKYQYGQNQIQSAFTNLVPLQRPSLKTSLYSCWNLEVIPIIPSFPSFSIVQSIITKLAISSYKFLSNSATDYLE